MYWLIFKPSPSQLSSTNWAQRDNQGRTLLDIAMDAGSSEIRCIIEEKMRLNAGNLQSFPPPATASNWTNSPWAGEGAALGAGLECPVCFHQFRAGEPLHQCGSGHLVCGVCRYYIQCSVLCCSLVCRPRVQHCPTCRGNMTGRCHAMEQHLAQCRQPL